MRYEPAGRGRTPLEFLPHRVQQLLVVYRPAWSKRGQQRDRNDGTIGGVNRNGCYRNCRRWNRNTGRATTVVDTIGE